jgi:serine/threonine protein kinase
MGIAHRDIKLENLVFDKDMTPKIIDFGFSTGIDKENYLRCTHCGSLAFVPPEFFTSFAYDAKKADIWSLGITIFVMIAGYFPWNPEEDGKNVLRQIYHWDCVIPESFPKAIKTLLSRMLVKDPLNRATTEELLSLKTVWTKVIGSSTGDIEIRRFYTMSKKPVSQTPEPLMRRRTIIRPNLKPKKLRVISTEGV